MSRFQIWYQVSTINFETILARLFTQSKQKGPKARGVFARWIKWLHIHAFNPWPPLYIINPYDKTFAPYLDIPGPLVYEIRQCHVTSTRFFYWVIGLSCRCGMFSYGWCGTIIIIIWRKHHGPFGPCCLLKVNDHAYSLNT